MSGGKRKPTADLSLDLDNKWSYLKTHGDEAWKSHPSYLPVVVPRILDILAEHQLKITVMVVGQDAAIEENLTCLRSIAAAGHEIGNHSFNHEPWLQFYSDEELDRELTRAEEALRAITDQKIVGFRGPGYCLSPDILNWLKQHEYEYDASTFPTFLGPVARAYYFFKSNLSREQQDERKQLFGSVKDGFRSLRPYHWETRHGPLLELPVTTMPWVRAPFHFSYLLYLAQYSEWGATLYFRWSLWLCRLTGTAPSMLLHPLDFLGGDEIHELDFFPAMNLTGRYKRRFISKMLGVLTKHFDVVPMRERASQLMEDGSLRSQPLASPGVPG